MSAGRHVLTHELGWEGVCSCGSSSHIYRVETTKGFTDSFSGKTVRTLVDLGLVLHKEDGFDLRDGNDIGIGPLVRKYGP